jgi:hypothetical protein
MDDEYGYAMDDAINALQYLDDLKELEKIALNGMIVHGQNYKDVQLTAMEKLVSLTTDITVLKKIKKVADGNSHFFYFKGTIDDRINQLSKQ